MCSFSPCLWVIKTLTLTFLERVVHIPQICSFRKVGMIENKVTGEKKRKKKREREIITMQC